MTTLFTAGSPLTPENLSFHKVDTSMEDTVAEERWYHQRDSGTISDDLRRDYSTQNYHSFANMCEDTRIPLHLSLNQQIQHLREEMNSLRGNSSSFKDRMEHILSTLENLNEVSFYRKSAWHNQTLEDANGNEDIAKTPISFGSSDGRKWVTGIASRISRSDVDSQMPLCTKTFPEISFEARGITAAATNDPNVQPTFTGQQGGHGQNAGIHMRSRKIEFASELNTKASNKSHLKLAETRPNSDSFVPTRMTSQAENTIERETTLSQENKQLTPADEENFSNPSPKSATGEEQVRMLPVLDRTSKTLLTSEDSIDSGYHGGVVNRNFELIEQVDLRLSAMRDIPKTSTAIKTYDENNDDVPVRPSTLALNCASVRKESDPTHQKIVEESVIELRNENDYKMIPKVLPRSTKRIKMGVSAVVGPKPKARTVFKSPTEEKSLQIATSIQNVSNHNFRSNPNEEQSNIHQSSPSKHEIKRKTKTKLILNRERTDTNGKVSGSEEESSSAVRRRSMRMLTEFKLFDFSDSTKGINSSIKNSPKKAHIKKKSDVKNEQKCVSEKKITLHSVVQTSCQVEKQHIPRRSNPHVKGKKKSELKIQKEALPPPPLPPPPSPPIEAQDPVKKEAPFVSFTSLAAHHKEAMICQAGTGTPLSSPRCVRRPVHGSNRSLQSTGTVSFNGSISGRNVQVTNLTPSEGSAFTPVGITNKSSQEVLPTTQYRPESKEDRFIKVNNENEVVPFKRRSSLPPSAISHRNQFKKSHPKQVEMQKDVKTGSASNIRALGTEMRVTNEVNFKRSVSMRVTKSKLPYAARNDLENHPIAFNPDDNFRSVVGKLKEAGYLEKKTSGKKTEVAIKQKTKSPMKASKQGQITTVQSSKVRNKLEETKQSPRVGGRSEQEKIRNICASQQTSQTIVGRRETSCGEYSQTKESTRSLITMGLIRSSFRSKRGKSAPSATNAAHEFSMGTSYQHHTVLGNIHPQAATANWVKDNSRNKVKQRMDLKPATPTPAVAKARRKKLASEKSSKTSVVGMLIDKLQLSRSDSSTNAIKRATKDATHTGRQRDQQVAIGNTHSAVAASVPIARKIFKFPSREENLKCGSLTSSSSISSLASHAPNSPLKGRSTYV